MGQAQSDESSSSSSPVNETKPEEESPIQQQKQDDVDAAKPASLDSLLAEATAFGDSEGESLDEKAQKALDCPCVAGLRSGPCGTQFSQAFLCFLKSTAEEKGSDCVHPFVALQDCIKAYPDAFSKGDMGEDKKKEEEEHTEEYRILPPRWSLEPTPKL